LRERAGLWDAALFERLCEDGVGGEDHGPSLTVLIKKNSLIECTDV
jgi:hypothetical protein